MKRIVAASILFCITIGLIALSACCVENSLSKLKDNINQLYSACDTSNKEIIEEAKGNVMAQWERSDVVLELFINGARIDAVEQLIETLNNQPDTEKIRDICIRAESAVKQIANSEKITLKNIL